MTIISKEILSMMCAKVSEAEIEYYKRTYLK